MLIFEKKPFQFWREIWIWVVVILLQLYRLAFPTSVELTTVLCKGVNVMVTYVNAQILTNLRKHWCVKPKTSLDYHFRLLPSSNKNAQSVANLMKHWWVKPKTSLNCTAISNFYKDLLIFPTSVVNMIIIAMFLIICFISAINGQNLPDQKFVTDLKTNFNRLGIIHHLPMMKRSHILDYYKSFNQYKWVAK